MGHVEELFQRFSDCLDWAFLLLPCLDSTTSNTQDDLSSVLLDAYLGQWGTNQFHSLGQTSWKCCSFSCVPIGGVYLGSCHLPHIWRDLGASLFPLEKILYSSWTYTPMGHSSPVLTDIASTYRRRTDLVTTFGTFRYPLCYCMKEQVYKFKRNHKKLFFL